MKIHIFAQRHIWDVDFLVEKGNALVAIHGSNLSKTKDVFDGGIRFRHNEWTEESLMGLMRFIKTDAGDFAGGGVDLVIVVTGQLVLENGSAVFDLA
jgi:hypothetical protein